MLGETFLNYSVDDATIQIPGYNLYRINRDAGSGKRGGGGVCAYVRDHYYITFISERNLCTPDLEYLWLKLSLPNTRNTFIGALYRPLMVM